MRLRLQNGGARGTTIVSDPSILIVAGYTGREPDAVQAHIHELERLGIAPPSNVPTFFSLSPDLLTQADVITETHRSGSGEAEFALVQTRDGCLVTVGSDHTDRALERSDLALSKMVCPKVIATAAWRLEEVIEHWDELQLLSWISKNGRMQVYQEGSVAQLIPPSALLELVPWRHQPVEYVVFGGTIATRSELSYSTRFRTELRDPVLRRTLALEYEIRAHTQMLFAVGGGEARSVGTRRSATSQPTSPRGPGAGG